MFAIRAPRLGLLLSGEEMKLIAAVATRKKYRDGEIIHERGDRDRAIGLVASGRIKLVYPCNDGTEVFSGLIHTGQNYGDAALLHAEPRPHRAVAIGETEIEHIGMEAFAKLLDHPNIVRAFYMVAAARLSVTMALLDDLRTLPPDVRLARLIARMHHANPASSRVEFLQEDLAGMLGISTVTFAKALRELAGRGFVKSGYGHILINDPDGLFAWIAERDRG